MLNTPCPSQDRTLVLLRRLHGRLASLCLIAVSLGWLLGESSPVWGAAAQRRPNVVVLMTDDQGLGDFSFMGNPVLQTPNFDALARQAVRFTDFHVCPMCSPTRGQLMSGLAALRNGATSVTAGRTFMRPGLPTLAEAFSRSGYATGLFGKWHLGDFYPHRPLDKGFRESVYHLGWGMLNSTPEFDWPLFDGRYFHNGVAKAFKGHCTDWWFDSAMSWIKQCKQNNEPFFCYLPTNAPHAPHIDLDKYVKPYEGKGPAGFFGMIAHVDARFGDLERFLVEEKLADDTIVILMTDNGGTSGVKTFNAGLRAGKTTYYDGGHRVPCWVRWPNGQLGAPRDIHVPTQNTDLFPTLCELCGVEEPQRDAAERRYRGTSLVGLLRGQQTTLADRKLVVQYGQIPKKFEACVIWGKWRLVGGKELYDTDTDRAQANDLADANPSVVQAMREYYESWWAGLEPIINEFVPMSIGAKQEPVVELTSGDWEGIYADNSGYVREAVGGPNGGHWHIQIEEPGNYEFTLRRWPERARIALGAKYEYPANAPPTKTQGKVKGFPQIARGTVEIAGVRGTAAAKSQDTAVTVMLANLPRGKTKLKAWFSDAEGNDLCGAFFVTVVRQP